MSGFKYPKAMVRNLQSEIIIKRDTLREAVAKMQNADSVELQSENGLTITLSKPNYSWVKAYKATCNGVAWWVSQKQKKVRANEFSLESSINSSVWVSIRK